MTSPPLFPRGFLWGAATSAYQIEGSPLADGAGPSNWHRFTHTAGRIAGGDTGDLACDHYRRWRDDILLMKQLGLKAYRFSLAWNRIMPDGIGAVNNKGLDFYLKLVDTLNEEGIEPFVTLHHWDLPACLDERGGWTHRDSAQWFADYAERVFRAFKGRVNFWSTFNEPWVIVDAGYLHTAHPPALGSVEKAALATHNLLRAHGMAVQSFRAAGSGQIGLVVNLEPKYAATHEPDDVAAMGRMHAWMNCQFLDPVLLGSYPVKLNEIYGADWQRFPAADMSLIQQPIDFLGINYYSRGIVRNDPTATPFLASPVKPDKVEYTEMGWEVFPEGLKICLLWVQKRYGDIPLYVTENGAAFADPPVDDGSIHDPRRMVYYRLHLQSALDALRKGVPLRGYFAWSLLDNFEWTAGYSKRFGLIGVDYITQTRTLKDSALFYRRVIESDGQAIWE